MKDRKLDNSISGGLEIESLISAAAYPIRYFAKLYQISSEEREFREVTVQPSRATTDYEKKVVIREPSVMELRFQDLPVNLQLLIFSYLDANTLCRIAGTCQYWQMLSEDKVLWAGHLWRDLHTWKSISHMTYPYTYVEANSELTPKQITFESTANNLEGLFEQSSQGTIYLRCCPKCQSLRQSRSTTRSLFASLVLHNLQNIPNLFGRRPPKVVMFGPGLESETSKLVQRILWDARSPFRIMGMFPGEFEGVGSGVCLKLNNTELNLITLYAASRAERERNAKEGKERVSKLLAAAEHDENQLEDDDENPVPQPSAMEVSHPVKELCKTVDAFIYVVDSSAQSQRVNIGDRELQAIMNNSWAQPRVPLLVLSSVAMETTPSLSCARVTELLNMNKFNRPWQVNSICVDNLEGFLDGVSWLLKQVI